MPVESLFMSIAEVAQRYQVTINRVREWESEGLLKVYRSGKRKERLFKRSEVRAFIYGGSNVPG